MATIINASTSAGLIQTADTSGTLQLQSNGVTQQTVDSTGSYGQLKQGTAQASTSGTSITFSSIPSWVRRITVVFNEVSTSGTSLLLVQVGSGSVTSTGYISSSARLPNAGAIVVSSSTSGFVSGQSDATFVFSGHFLLTLNNAATNNWICSHNGKLNTAQTIQGGGSVSLSGTLDRVVITTVNGTDTFDAGSINILYEG